MRIDGIAASHTAKVFRTEIAAALVDLMHAKHTYGECQNTLPSTVAVHCLLVVLHIGIEF